MHHPTLLPEPADSSVWHAPAPSARYPAKADEAAALAADPAVLRDVARDLAARFAELAGEHDRTGAPPAAQIQALFDAGLLRLTIARRDGGHGAGLGLASEVVGIIATGDPSVALILAMHYSQHAAIARSRRLPDGAGAWPHELAGELIAHALDAPALINAIQVEPALGSPSHGGTLATTARCIDGHWRICGHKLYSTGSHLLSWLAVLAITDEASPRIGSFLVPRDAPGVRIIETWDPMGMRATASHDIVFEDVDIPLEHAVGLYDASHGLRRDPLAQSWYFNLVGAVYTGAARAAQAWLADFLVRRRPSALNGAALADLPGPQDTVGQIELWLDTSDALLAHHARVFDTGGDAVALGATAKHVAIDHAVQATTLALELAGNHGISRNNPLERHFRNAQCARLHAPPNALLRGNAGRARLREAAGAGP